MREISDAIVGGATGGDLGTLEVPTSYQGAVVRREDTEMFSGLSLAEKDPAKSIHCERVATPELAPDEV